jgi:bifunctional DNA-binding transcriptional regulator/antitoxin component of YhaV-PrlF toxin-antitoxin module
MAGPAAALSVPAGVVYGTGRIDASGRIADQAIMCALGWRDGDRLTLTAEPGIVVARRDPGGMVTVPARGCLAIPAVLRRRCGLRAGDRVLLAAVPGQDTLTAFSLAVVDQALRAHGTFPHATGGQP